MGVEFVQVHFENLQFQKIKNFALLSPNLHEKRGDRPLFFRLENVLFDTRRKLKTLFLQIIKT